MTLDAFGLRFHHFGLAVRDVAAATKVLDGLGYDCGDEIRDPLQEVRLVWCSHPAMPAVEIVAPTDRPGPVDNILAQNAHAIYHLCFEARDIAESVAAIKSAGVRVLPVSDPKPAVLFAGRRVGFYQVKGFGLIEILEDS